ncbi:MAG: Hsp20/alpha crystallin family protein [Oscillospiraceae bacterium]
MFLTPFNRKYELSSYDPFRVFDDMEKNFWGDHATTSLSTFKTDIREEGDNYVLEADLPGFKKEDIKIDLEDGYMTISAERHSSYEEKDKKGNYVRCERSYGSFARSFDTSGIDVEGMTASFNDGVLTLTMPKLVEPAPVARRLEIQ